VASLCDVNKVLLYTVMFSPSHLLFQSSSADVIQHAMMGTSDEKGFVPTPRTLIGHCSRFKGTCEHGYGCEILLIQELLGDTQVIFHKKERARKLRSLRNMSA
jgi:hypothetical protein